MQLIVTCLIAFGMICAIVDVIESLESMPPDGQRSSDMYYELLVLLLRLTNIFASMCALMLIFYCVCVDAEDYECRHRGLHAMLGYFDPEVLEPEVDNVDNVDIELQAQNARNAAARCRA